MMKQQTTKIAITLLSLILIAGCATTPTGQIAKEESHSVGILAPLTGAGATLGQAYVQGAELYAQEHPSINKRKLIIEIEDSKFDGPTSVSAVQYLIDTKKVDLITTLFHLPAQAASPLSEEAGVPLIYEAYTTSIKDNNPYAFKANLNAEKGCEKLVRYAQENKAYEQLGVLMAQTEYNELCLRGMRKVDPNIKEYWYTFGETDYKTILLKMEREGVDAIGTIMIDFEYSALFKQLSEGEFEMKVICATASECIHPAIKKTIPAAELKGTISIDFVPQTLKETSMGKKYLKQYPESTPMELNYAAMGYEMMSYASETMKACQPQDHECMIESLQRTNNYKTVIDSQGFDENRTLQISTDVYIYDDGWQKQ